MAGPSSTPSTGDESGSDIAEVSGDFNITLNPPNGAQSFYLVSDFDGKSWGANDEQGFLFEDFVGTRINSNWTMNAGTWQFQNGKILQSDENAGNSNIYADIRQESGEAYLYHWKVRLLSGGDNKRFGFHFFCSDASKTNRGDSYFAWFRNNQARQDKVEIYRVQNNKFEKKNEQNISISHGDLYDCKLFYHPGTGQIRIYLNEQQVLAWKDPNPHRSGNAISLRTGESRAEFSNLRVYKLSQGNQAKITVGNSSSMARFKSQGNQPAVQVIPYYLDRNNRWVLGQTEKRVVK